MGSFTDCEKCHYNHGVIRALIVACALAPIGLAQLSNPTYRATLVLENGASLPSSPLIIPPPAGSDLPPCRDVSIFANGEITYIVPVFLDPGEDPIPRHFDDKCRITISVKGYKKTTVTLHNNAVVVLKQMGDPEGSTVSLTSLRVPKAAAKAYDKGIAALADEKLPVAQKWFEEAVALYPEYAQAWSSLGETLEQQSQISAAVAACEHALQADVKYVRPYLQLMRMAVNEKRMEDAAALGERAMQLNPVEFPGIFYYDAEANYKLKHLDAAEKTAQRAIDLDTAHRYPRAEALLGMILADKGDAAGALRHLNAYLALAPGSDDADEVRGRIEELQKSSPAVQ
jgi:tetratricopeptide (TPR) repeat protein